MASPNFKKLVGGSKTTKSANVFPWKVFPLYGISNLTQLMNPDLKNASWGLSVNIYIMQQWCNAVWVSPHQPEQEFPVCNFF